MEIKRNSHGYFYREKPVKSVLWPFFDLLVVHHGCVDVCADNKYYELTANSCLLIFPHTRFSIATPFESCAASVHHFQLASEEYTGAFSHLNKFNTRINDAFFCRFAGKRQLITDIERLLACENQFPDQGHLDAFKVNLLNLILLQLIQKPTKKVPTYTKHQMAIEQLIYQAKQQPSFSLNVDQMAKQVNLSASHFRAIFQGDYNESPLAYFQRLKMQHACRLLTNTQAPIKSISLDLGYDEVSYFYRHFKKHMGVTPRTFRSKQVPNKAFY